MSSSYLAAPRFTDEEEEAEKASMTQEEQYLALRDLYGVMLPDNVGECGKVECKVECADGSDGSEQEPIERGLEDLDAELDRLIHNDLSEENGDGFGKRHLNAACIEKAKQLCPEIINSQEHRLLFLRAEGFNAKRAADLLIEYWSERITLFGEDKAFLPLTLSGALRDDEVGLSMGFIILSPERDISGRAIVIVDQSKLERKNYTRNMMLRVVWYVIHAAVEDEEIQRKGIVMLCTPRNAQFDQFDRKLESKVTHSLRDALPVIWVGLHFCHAPAFYELIAPNAKYILGRKMRARTRWHSGSFRSVLETLAEYGINPTSIPSEYGGEWNVDGKWLEERRAKGL